MMLHITIATAVFVLGLCAICFGGGAGLCIQSNDRQTARGLTALACAIVLVAALLAGFGNG